MTDVTFYVNRFGIINNFVIAVNLHLPYLSIPTRTCFHLSLESKIENIDKFINSVIRCRATRSFIFIAE